MDIGRGIDLATMEGANESARHAVAALPKSAGSTAAPPQTWTLYQPEELEPIKRTDELRWAMGQPNLFDVG